MTLHEKKPQIKNSGIPLLLLSGVLVFSVLVTYLNLASKLLVLTSVVAGYLFSGRLNLGQLGKMCYRFRYLVLSIAVLNLMFSTDNILIALDKTLLLLLMLAVVNAYLHIQSNDDIVTALHLFLRPLKPFAIDANKSAQLIAATLNSVESLQNDTTISDTISNPVLSNSGRFDQLINNLVLWIQKIEHQALQVDKLDSPKRDFVLTPESNNSQ